MSAVGPRSSTKNVSVPLPPVRKFDPVPPSSTLVPLVTAIASSPPPLTMNQLGVAAVMFRLSVVILIYCCSRPLRVGTGNRGELVGEIRVICAGELRGLRIERGRRRAA